MCNPVYELSRSGSVGAELSRSRTPGRNAITGSSSSLVILSLIMLFYFIIYISLCVFITVMFIIYKLYDSVNGSYEPGVL